MVKGDEAMQEPADSGFKEILARSHDEPVFVILAVQGSGTNLLSRLLVRLFNFSVLHDRSIVFNAAARLGASPTTSAVEREIRRFEDVVGSSALRRKTRKEVLRKNKHFQGLDVELRRSPI